MILIPKAVREEAAAFARDAVDKALGALFGFIEDELARRRSAAFAHEKALYHGRMAAVLPHIALVDLNRRVRRQKRLSARWAAKAYARDAVLALQCGLGCTESGLV